MAIFLNEVVQSPVEDTDTGGVTVSPTEAGQELQLSDSTGTPQIVISDATTSIADGVVTVSDTTNDFSINGTAPLNAVVTTFSHATTDPDKKVATVGAITDFFDTQSSGVLEYTDLSSKVEFDAFLTTDPMSPTITLVTDATSFDYTDTKGVANTGLTWWLGICEHFVGEDLVTSTLFTSNSQNSLSGTEIKAALFSEADTNNYDDSAKGIVDSITTLLASKVDVVAGKTLSSEDYTAGEKLKVYNCPLDVNDALSNKADTTGEDFTGIVQATALGVTAGNAQQAIAIGNDGVTDSGQSGIGWRVGADGNARTGNYRAQVRMNYDNGDFEVRTGNSSNINNLGAAISVDSGRQVSVNGSPVLTEFTGLQTNSDCNIGNASLTISNPGTGDGYLELNNSSAAANQEKYRLYSATNEALKLESVDDSGNSVSTYEFFHNGDFHTPGNVELDGNLVMFDAGGHEHRFEHGSDGIELRAMTNPSSGEPIFTVSSSGGNKRLVVEHDNAVTTSNDEIRVGTDADGSNGRVVLEEGNWALLQDAVSYSNSFPSPSNADKVYWSGRDITFTSVGAGSMTMPSIVSDNPSSSQIRQGEVVRVHNFNSGSAVTLTAASGQKMVNGNVSNTSGTGGSITLEPGNSAFMIASDESSVSTIGTFAWLVRPFG